jgi:PAS domain S-box-containing protein
VYGLEDPAPEEAAPRPGLRWSLDRLALWHCRLCWQVTAAVFFGILFVEAVILVPSYLRYEQDRLFGYYRSGETATIGALRAVASDASASALERTAQRLVGVADIRGLAFFDADGRRIAGSGAEPPASVVRSPDLWLQRDRTTLDAKWTMEGAPVRTIAARLDTVGLSDALRNFVLRITGLIGLISLVVTAVTMLVLRRLVLGPIIALDGALSAAGHDPNNAHLYQVAVPAGPKNELASICAKFNRMLHDVADNLAGLKKRDHERLLVVKARLEYLLNSSPAMIYSFKASGDYAATFASANIRSQLGHEPREFLKNPRFWSDHIHPDDAPRVLNELGLLFKSGHHVQEYRFHHKNGGYRWMRDELVLVKDEAGNPLEVVGYWVDITDRKRAEETVKAYAERLERSNRELQDFAYVASHDLQEPLRKIEAFGDRLQSKCGDALSEDGRMYLERMRNAATRMRSLINDLLTYSRVTTKAQPFVPTDLNVVLEGVVSDLHVAIERSGARIEAGRLPTIDADATQMRQLLQNLIGNALKFRKPDAPPVVTVSGERVTDTKHASSTDEPDGNWCRITVADNGIGFDQKYADRIFNMFERLHGRGEYEGTGIGLATCRKIVERHGGTIEARSVPGEGSTFVVSLPARHSKQETANEPDSGAD